jgi:hypothetical protein
MKANLLAMVEEESKRADEVGEVGEGEGARMDEPVLAPGAGGDVLFLLPNELVTDPKYNVRPYSSQHDNGEESARVEKLARSIEKDGQLDDMLVIERQQTVYEGKGLDARPAAGALEHVLLAGSRRRRAIAMLNGQRTSQGQAQVRCRVRVLRGKDAEEVLRKALVSNIQRQNLSAMDLALNIDRLTKENKWEGFKGDKKIAAYLEVSVATVTQHRKFLTADKGLQAQLHEGVLSAQSAFELLEVPAEKRERVVARAQEIQREDDLDKALKTKGGEGKKAAAVQAAVDQSPSKRRVKAPAVRQAIVEVAPEAAAKVTRAAILEWFDAQDGPGSAAAVRAFVRYLVDKWVVGEGTERTLREKWDAATVEPSKGELKAAEKAEKAEEAAAKNEKKAKK